MPSSGQTPAALGRLSGGNAPCQDAGPPGRPAAALPHRHRFFLLLREFVDAPFLLQLLVTLLTLHLVQELVGASGFLHRSDRLVSAHGFLLLRCLEVVECLLLDQFALHQVFLQSAHHLLLRRVELLFEDLPHFPRLHDFSLALLLFTQVVVL